MALKSMDNWPINHLFFVFYAKKLQSQTTALCNINVKKKKSKFYNMYYNKN